VLDIGGQFGALIVYTDPERHGTEVQISPQGEDSNRSHKDVLERGEGGRVAFTAVFDRLPAGAYTLWTGASHARVASWSSAVPSSSSTGPPACRPLRSAPARQRRASCRAPRRSSSISSAVRKNGSARRARR
jgi:hypothetical protein